MKKWTFTIILALALAAVPAQAQTGNVAIGPVFSLNFQGVSSPLNGLGITGKLPGLAPVFGLNFSLGLNTDNFLGVTADWILYKQPLYAPWGFNFFMGPGFYSSVYVVNGFADGSHFDLGLRIPIGINWTPLRFLEIFSDVIPAFGITFRNPVTPGWLFQAEAGARFWF